MSMAFHSSNPVQTNILEGEKAKTHWADQCFKKELPTIILFLWYRAPVLSCFLLVGHCVGSIYTRPLPPRIGNLQLSIPPLNALGSFPN